MPANDTSPIECPHCGAKTTLKPDSPLRQNGGQATCPKCRETFEIPPPAPLPSLAEALTSPAPEPSKEAMNPLIQAYLANSRRVAVLIFFATLTGSLIGVAANLSAIGDLMTRTVEWFDPSPRLTIIGSNTILGSGHGMAEAWKNYFQDQHKWEEDILFGGRIERTVLVSVQGIGSLDGLEKAEEGKAHLLAMSEPMDQYDQIRMRQQGIRIRCAAEIGYDVVVFVTDMKNDVPVFSNYGISSLLKGDVHDWMDVTDDVEEGPIRVLARQGSGTTEIVLNAFTDSSEFRDHYIQCESNSACLDMALSIPGSIYWVSSAWLHTQPPRYIHPILIRKPDKPITNPLKKDFVPHHYPRELIRPLYMYVLEGSGIDPESTRLAMEFLHFIRGVRGQEVLEQHHFYTYFDPPSDVAVALPPGFGAQKDGPPVVCLEGD